MCCAVMKLSGLTAVPVNEPTRPSYCHPEFAKAPVGADVLRPVPPMVIIALDRDTNTSDKSIAKKVWIFPTPPRLIVMHFLPVSIASSFTPSVEQQIQSTDGEEAIPHLIHLTQAVQTLALFLPI
jgi:hypothetical protein